MKISFVLCALLFSCGAFAVTTETVVVRSYLHASPEDPYRFQATTARGVEDLVPMTREAATELEKLKYGVRYECQLESHKSASSTGVKRLVYAASLCHE